MTADELRALLLRCGLSQRGAARRLQIDERAMRRYCCGTRPVPVTVWLALLQIAEHQQEET